MHGAGFGLGFLNLIGTVLFFAFIVMAIKFFVKGGRYAGYRNHNGPWHRGAPWMHGSEGLGKDGATKDGFRRWQGEVSEDEAMSVARERLASGQINPEQFEAVKQGLKVDMSDSPLGRHDKAVHLARLRFAKGEITAEEFEAVKKTLLA
jgi:uncharacterized membrane protein